jgi:glutaredoxin-like protein NrdH
MEWTGMDSIHVEGKDEGEIFLYALSTCQWCKKTRELLEELNVAFDYVYVDLLKDEEMKTVIDKVTQFNPRGSFPTLLISSRCIVGFREDQIREALEA